jgi:hypothetical protein
MGGPDAVGLGRSSAPDSLPPIRSRRSQDRRTAWQHRMPRVATTPGSLWLVDDSVGHSSLAPVRRSEPGGASGDPRRAPAPGATVRRRTARPRRRAPLGSRPAVAPIAARSASAIASSLGSGRRTGPGGFCIGPRRRRCPRRAACVRGRPRGTSRAAAGRDDANAPRAACGAPASSSRTLSHPGRVPGDRRLTVAPRSPGCRLALLAAAETPAGKAQTARWSLDRHLGAA